MDRSNGPMWSPISLKAGQWGHSVFICALGDIAVPGVASKEDLGGLSPLSPGDGFDYPRSPQGLVVVCQGSTREMLAGSADYFDSRFVVMETVLMLIPPIKNARKNVEHISSLVPLCPYPWHTFSRSVE